MAKPQAQTFQQKLGFFEEDLKKPKHDELMLWLDQNILEIVNKLFSIPLTDDEMNKKKSNASLYLSERLIFLKNRHKNCYSSSDQKYYQEEIKAIEEFDIVVEKIPKKPLITEVNKKWEVTVNQQNKNFFTTIGFIDFVGTFNLPVLALSGYNYDTSNGKILCSNYVSGELGFTYIFSPTRINIEVKTEINSLGELIRQINLYKLHEPSDFYVMCPDNKHKSLLADQGIGFIEYY